MEIGRVLHPSVGTVCGRRVLGGRGLWAGQPCGLVMSTADDSDPLHELLLGTTFEARDFRKWG